MINTPENYGGVNWTPELKGDLECIYQNSQHLKSLIDDVLTWQPWRTKSTRLCSVMWT